MRASLRATANSFALSSISQISGALALIFSNEAKLTLAFLGETDL